MQSQRLQEADGKGKTINGGMIRMDEKDVKKKERKYCPLIKRKCVRGKCMFWEYSTNVNYYTCKLMTYNN